MCNNSWQRKSVINETTAESEQICCLSNFGLSSISATTATAGTGPACWKICCFVDQTEEIWELIITENDRIHVEVEGSTYITQTERVDVQGGGQNDEKQS